MTKPRKHLMDPREVGMRMIRHGLAASRLPAGCKHVSTYLSRLRRSVVYELERRGKSELTIAQLAWINSMVRHETRAQLCARWLRKAPDLTLTERLDLLREVSKATDARDRALEKLGLDKEPVVDIIATYFRHPEEASQCAS